MNIIKQKQSAHFGSTYTKVKQKQSHRSKKQTSSYQWRGGREERQDRCRGLRRTNYCMYKINKLQGYIVQHREYSQYFIITLNGV